jgi:3-hydroxyacyl-CoA dehydrogenase
MSSTYAGRRQVAVIGAGSIGVAFSVVFARAGWQVCMQDPDEQRRDVVHAEAGARLDALQAHGLLEQWETRVAWRDRELMRVAALKKQSPRE